MNKQKQDSPDKDKKTNIKTAKTAIITNEVAKTPKPRTSTKVEKKSNQESKQRLTKTFIENIKIIKKIRTSLADDKLSDKEILAKFRTAVHVMRSVIDQLSEFSKIVNQKIQKKLDEQS